MSNYQTTPDRFKDDIGTLSPEQISKLLIACQNAIKEQYPVAGTKDIFSKVHDKGEYGAYRLTIQQLVDASWLGYSAKSYINSKLIDHPEGPEKLENRKSYFEHAKETKTQLDFSDAKIEAKNNAQYYFLTNKLEGVAINNLITDGSDIVSSGSIQDRVAYDYLKFIYNLLYTARIVNDSTDNTVVAGLMSVSLCVNYDTAASYSRGIIKVDANGISSKYWYDIGWNSVAETPLKISTPKPNVQEVVLVEGGATSTEKIIDKIKVNYRVVGSNISGRILYDGEVVASSMPVSIQSISNQLDRAIRAARILGSRDKFLALRSAKRRIEMEFADDIAPIRRQLNIIDPTITRKFDSLGNIVINTLITNPDGTKTTVIETTGADGIRTKEKIQEKVVLETKPAVTDVTDPSPTEVQNAATNEEVNRENSTETFRANNLPINTESLPLDEQDDTVGFKDPDKQYPTTTHLHKPDTNPLATGINSPQVGASPKTSAGNKETLSAGASPAARNASRKRGVETAGRNGATWEQPESPYNAEYPYNKVFGSESGHAIEIDDTPGSERLNWAHRSGTFTETGPDGTQVTKIVGDGYTIVDKNGYILVEGIANVHVAGNCNVIILNDTNLTMHGRVSLDIHNDVDVNIGGRLSLSVGEGIFARNGGSMSLETVGDIDSAVSGNITTDVIGEFNMTSDAGVNLTSNADTHIKSSGEFFNHSAGDMNMCTDAGVKVKSAAATEIKSGAEVNFEGAGNINLKSPLVASSPIDTPTLGVTTANITTLNAGSTNLRATGTDTGINGGSTHDLPISGPTSATVTVPSAAAEAACAVAATLSNTKTVELPVSRSFGSNPQYVGGSTDGVGGGNQGAADNTSNDVPDEPDSGSEECVDPRDPTIPSGPDFSPEAAEAGDEQVGDFGSVPPAIAGCDRYRNGQPLPALGGNRITGDIILSDNYKLKDFFPTRKLSQFIPYTRGNKTLSKWDIIQNYRCLALNILEPLREKYPGFRINSGFRQDTTSAHRYAAVDLQWPNYASNKRKMVEIANFVATSLPRCDQILLETANGNTAWLHIGYVLWNGQKRSGNANGTARQRGKQTIFISKGRFVPW